eukprot:CAMPEP_0169093886 /NCGR_PEP_ID=MMETSP1015-20121227/17670_1 /TAXON_ID=342587 /ORGANISM="Karlodinium micrum, Strain CCMP2283" /LENGTH=105 /DNA_ID=CAMNT_0009154545 /DNA_START=265 /DNA_END=582 /DNA_ORIENTATION=+
MKAFPQLPIADDFRDLHTDRIPVDIEYNASAAMVKAVWHALLNGSIHHNIDKVAAFENGKITGDTRHTLAFVFLGEFIACAMAVTPRLCASSSHSEGKFKYRAEL